VKVSPNSVTSPPIGMTAIDQEASDHPDERGEVVDDLVDHPRGDVLLEEHLGAVDEGLQDPEGADPVGPERDCILATTRRSAQISTAVISR
jgi:hypothetical protein